MKIRFISVFILLLFTNCSPSPAMVQTAIAQTEKAKPTYIPRPTIVSTTTPTSLSTLEPDYTQLVFQDPFTWPDDVKSKFPGLFSGRFDSSTIQAFNYFLETIWGQVLNLDAETIRSYDPFQLLLLAKDYAKKEGELEIALPTSWRNALINKPTNYLSVIHKTGEVGPDSQEISSGSGDYILPEFYRGAGIKNGYAIGYFFVPSYGDQKAKLYYMATYGITGKLSLLFFIPGVSSVIAEEALIEMGPDQYILRRLQYLPQVTSSGLAICGDKLRGFRDGWITCSSATNFPATQLKDPVTPYDHHATHEFLLAMMRTYGDFFQIRSKISGGYIVDFVDRGNAGVLLEDQLEIPQLPTNLDPNVFNRPTISTKRIDNFEIYADLSWQDTGIMVEPGDLITVTFASGSWRWWGGGPDLGPDGDPSSTGITCEGMGENDPRRHISGGALIGKISDNMFSEGPIFYLGGLGTYYVPGDQSPQRLYLALNDCDEGRWKTSGSITVNIKIDSNVPTSSPTP